MNDLVTTEKRSLIDTMAQSYEMSAAAFQNTVRATCLPKNATNEEFAAFLMVAHEHGLNPVTREIYAFPKKGGGIQPIVGIDGWMTLINSHPKMDGMQFVDHFDDKGNLTAVTCKIYRKDRKHETEVTEYMEECRRGSEPWTKWPARMLRHKAAIQCARYAFGFAGIIDPEEAERSPEVETGEIVAPPPPPAEETPEQEPETVDAVSEDVLAQQDIEQFLQSADEAFAVAETNQTLQEIWEADYADRWDDLPKDEAQKLFEVYSKHIGRVSQTDAA